MRDTPLLGQYKIALIGESCSDVYHYGETTRLSPEGPVPIFVPRKTEVKVGMAGNVKNNLSSLGSSVLFVTCDKKIKKERFIDERFSAQVLRVDNDFELSPLTEDVVKTLQLSDFDAIVISDYCKGFLPPDICDTIIKESGEKPVFIDTKKNDLSCFDKKNCFIKVNQTEYEKIIKEPKHARLIVTLGKDGAQSREVKIPGFQTNVFDVCGAGDVFLAGFAHAYLSKKSLEDSLVYANLAASVSLKFIGNHTVTPEEIKKRLSEIITEEEENERI